jgi:predicted kinase
MSATVHLLCGKTGSGKTTFARRLEQERRAVALSVDPWMIRLFGQHMPREAFDARLRVCMDLLYGLSERLTQLGVDVVLDWGFWSRADRDAARARFAASGAQVVLYFFDVSDDVILRRLKRRSEQPPGDDYEIPPEMFALLAAKFEPPGGDEACVRVAP